jgi:hypothetical protein
MRWSQLLADEPQPRDLPEAATVVGTLMAVVVAIATSQKFIG